MQDRFEYKRLPKYPHLSPADTAIWERFIMANPDEFERVEYDLHIGEGAAFLPTGDDSPEGRENRLYQKKIDVIGWRGNYATMIEVKPEAGMKALGQMIAYGELLKPILKLHTPLQKLIIAERMDDDFKIIFALHRIKVVLI